jgi:hypothetical protein
MADTINGSIFISIDFDNSAQPEVILLASSSFRDGQWATALDQRSRSALRQVFKGLDGLKAVAAQAETTGNTCPDCGGMVHHSEGCGWSKC